MNLLHKIIKKLFKKFFKFKIFVYSEILSNTRIVQGKAIINQPTLFLGAGQICIAENVSLGHHRFFIQATYTSRQDTRMP